MWKKDDKVIEYEKDVKKSFMETVKECAAIGGEIGAEIGGIFGKTGERIGRTVCTGLGIVVGVAKEIGRTIIDGAKSLFGW